MTNIPGLPHRTAFALVLLAALAALWFAGCGWPPQPTPFRPTPGAPRPPVLVGFDRDKDSYLPGEDVRLTLTLKNVSPAAVEVASFPPAIKILARSKTQGIYASVRVIPQGSDVLTVPAGHTRAVEVLWNQRDDSDSLVAPGFYHVQLGQSTFDGRLMQAVGGGGAPPFLVLPAEGVLENTLSVGASQTVNGVTFALERVEVTGKGMSVFAFSAPPAYAPPQKAGPDGKPLPPPVMMDVFALADYRFDDSETRTGNPSAQNYLDNGISHRWYNLDPAPKSAKVLTFRITRIGQYEGPWEWRIPLQ